MIIKEFRNTEFINRNKEIAFFKKYFSQNPERILWVYGPKSTGKTTLIEYIIENELSKNKLFSKSSYWIKYINFRGLFISNYTNFVESFLEPTDKNDDFSNEISSEFNLGVIKIKANTLQKIKNKDENLFNTLIINLQKIKKQKIIIIDEIQALEEIYYDEGKLLLDEFLNFCVRLTKELHLCHIVILTSNTLFLNRIYTNAKLKVTSSFKKIEHLEFDEINEWLKTKNFTEKEIKLIYEYLGGSTARIKKLMDEYKEFDSIEKYLENEVKIALNEIEFFIAQKDISDEDVEKFNFIAKEILENGYFYSKELKKYLKTISLFCEVEILFFDPINNITTTNSEIYNKAFEEMLK